jgi:hypothetical protein
VQRPSRGSLGPVGILRELREAALSDPPVNVEAQRNVIALRIDAVPGHIKLADCGCDNREHMRRSANHKASAELRPALAKAAKSGQPGHDLACQRKSAVQGNIPAYSKDNVLLSRGFIAVEGKALNNVSSRLLKMRVGTRLRRALLYSNEVANCA